MDLFGFLVPSFLGRISEWLSEFSLFFILVATVECPEKFEWLDR